MQLFVRVLLFIDTRSRLKTYIHVVIAHAIRAMKYTVSIITTKVISANCHSGRVQISCSSLRDYVQSHNLSDARKTRAVMLASSPSPVS